MSTDGATWHDLLAEVREHLHREARQASLNVKVRIGLRAALIALVIAYMSWLMGALSSLDARALTGIAAVEIEERFPELRGRMRDYALAVAPELTDRARDLVLQVPAGIRRQLEGSLMKRAETLVAELEATVDAALSDSLAEQTERLRARLGDVTAEAQLHALVLGSRESFRKTTSEALDALYVDYSQEVRLLNDYLEHLRRGVNLTPTEQIDRELLQVWMVLVDEHEITRLASAG